MKISGTALEENYAERAGGACFVENVHVLHTDCKLKAAVPLRALKSYHASNFHCSSMMGNSVGTGGYGDNIATFQTGFYAMLFHPNGTQSNIKSGNTAWIQYLHAGDNFPRLKVFVVDWFYQGPPLSENRDPPLEVNIIFRQLSKTERFV